MPERWKRVEIDVLRFPRIASTTSWLVSLFLLFAYIQAHLSGYLIHKQLLQIFVSTSLVLCLWFRASLIYINNCPNRCNTSSLCIILQVHWTCFGCQPHPSSGVHKTVTTASLMFPHQNPVFASPLNHTRYMPRPSHSSRCYHPHNIGWAVQIIKLLIM